MALAPYLAFSTRISHSREVIFAGDGVRLAGQTDYPELRTPAGGFPLLFLLLHTGCNTREHAAELAEIGVSAGFAVFRWDRRGTGRSGASGAGSATQDAVEAYATALGQPQINRREVIIVGQGAGSGLLGSAYGLFARVQPPRAALLLGSLLDPQAVQSLDTRVHIIQGEHDWNAWQTYSQAAARAHRAVYPHGATYTMLPGLDHDLISHDPLLPGFHPLLRGAVADWLRIVAQR
jgi:alpha-beta hydrolase superfamily lysophospholipase